MPDLVSLGMEEHRRSRTGCEEEGGQELGSRGVAHRRGVYGEVGDGPAGA